MNEKAEQAKRNLQEIFRKDPALGKAFKETIEELRKPENIKKTAEEICNTFNKMQQVFKDRR